MKFVSKLVLIFAFVGLIPNLGSAYSIKETKEQVKAGYNKTVSWIKKNPKKLTASFVLTCFALYSFASYSHLHTKMQSKGKAKFLEDKLENDEYLSLFFAALLLPVKETLSICVGKQNPVRIGMKNFINHKLLVL